VPAEAFDALVGNGVAIGGVSLFSAEGRSGAFAVTMAAGVAVVIGKAGEAGEAAFEFFPLLSVGGAVAPVKETGGLAIGADGATAAGGAAGTAGTAGAGVAETGWTATLATSVLILFSRNCRKGDRAATKMMMPTKAINHDEIF
jgi:hypothetical protein